MTTRILVTGANGQMGQALAATAQPSDQWEWHFVGRDSLDITDEEQVLKYVRFLQPDILINTSAFTAVDQAETDVDAAFLLNRDAVSYLAAASAAVDALFIHLSTDYVYDNGQNHPYSETDKVRPHSVYARSKLAGEKEALLLNPDAVILRTSWLYGPVRHNFLQTMLRLGRERETMNVVFDQVGTPTYTRDLAAAIIEILKNIRKNPPLREQFRGVFNYSNEGVASWYDFAEAIMRLKSLSCKVRPIRSSQYPTPARRPAYSVMDKHKISETFGLDIPHWMDGLERCLRLMEG
jgi:dTDP-4-dehydrorhamnose reductase